MNTGLELGYRNASLWSSFSLLLVIADQWTKTWAEGALEIGDPIYVSSVLNFALAYNEGAAFSFLNDAGGWQRWLLTSISLVASVVLFIWIARCQANQRWVPCALTWILGGAIGNLIDRASTGRVVDFIQFHWNDAYFPTFNIADTAITIGAIMLVIDMLFFAQAVGAEKEQSNGNSTVG